MYLDYDNVWIYNDEKLSQKESPDSCCLLCLDVTVTTEYCTKADDCWKVIDIQNRYIKPGKSPDCFFSIRPIGDTHIA
jgi:hypothetical protein